MPEQDNQITELRRESGAERFVGKNGEINASSRKDLLQNAMAFSSTVLDQEVLAVLGRSQRKKAEAVQAIEVEERNEIGATLAKLLHQAAKKEGFMRRFLLHAELGQGELAKFKFRTPEGGNVLVATSSGRYEPACIGASYMYPPEFTMTRRAVVMDLDRKQTATGSNPYAEAYLDVFEGLVCREDRMWLDMVEACQRGVLEYHGRPMHEVVMELRDKIDGPKGNMAFAKDLFKAAIGDTNFVQMIDVQPDHEKVLAGNLGSYLGFELLTESYRHPSHCVFEPGQIVAAAATPHGQYTDRGEVCFTPVDTASEGKIGHGWLFYEHISMVMSVDQSVVSATFK